MAYYGFCEGGCQRCEVDGVSMEMGCKEGVSPSHHEGSGQGTLPFPIFFVNFLVQTVSLLFKHFCAFTQGRGGHCPVPSPINMPLDTLLTTLTFSS